MRRVCSWQENANCTCYRHLVGSWNLNQSRAEVLPVGRSRVAGEEREGEPRSNTQSSTPSPGQEQKMSHCAKWSKAQNHSFRQAKPFWFSEGILVGMGQHRLMTRLFAKKSWKFTRNLHEESRKNLETICKHRRRFREFGAISGTYQNPPCSKPWAQPPGPYGPGFLLKIGQFRNLVKFAPTLHQESRMQLKFNL